MNAALRTVAASVLALSAVGAHAITDTVLVDDDRDTITYHHDPLAGAFSSAKLTITADVGAWSGVPNWYLVDTFDNATQKWVKTGLINAGFVGSQDFTFDLPKPLLDDLSSGLKVLIQHIPSGDAHPYDRALMEWSKLSAVAAPVPEPSEWALMLAGLGAVAFVSRRRKA